MTEAHGLYRDVRERMQEPSEGKAETEDNFKTIYDPLLLWWRCG